MELKLAGEAMDSRNKVASEASRFFFVMKFLVSEFLVATKVFFVVATILPIPIPCTGLPLEAGLIFVCSEVRKGGSDADAEWGLVLFATTGGKVRMRSVKNGL